MIHLTAEEMIDFISIHELTPETLALASKVNTHIRQCERCLTKLQAFQFVGDELTRQNRDIERNILEQELQRGSQAVQEIDVSLE